jgi:hypothetical protein
MFHSSSSSVSPWCPDILAASPLSLADCAQSNRPRRHVSSRHRSQLQNGSRVSTVPQVTARPPNPPAHIDPVCLVHEHGYRKITTHALAHWRRRERPRPPPVPPWSTCRLQHHQPDAQHACRTTKSAFYPHGAMRSGAFVCRCCVEWVGLGEGESEAGDGVEW